MSIRISARQNEMEAGMAAPLVRTKVPGIYRRGSRYVVKQRDQSGRMITRSAPTLAAAQDVKAALRSGSDTATAKRGSPAFDDYAREWLGSYTGRTSKGLKASTRDDYRRALEKDAIPFFSKKPLASIQPRDIKQYAARVAERGVSAHTVRLAVAPVKVLLATAFEDGLIAANPAANVRLAIPARPADEEQVKSLSSEQLRQLLDAVPAQYRLIIEFLSVTGMRIGEALALRWSDVDLERRMVHVRRNAYRGIVGAPKSRYGVRRIPLTPLMRSKLNEAKSEDADPDELVFVSRAGVMHDRQTVFRYGLKPAARVAGVPWAGLHTLRHTFASTCFRNGCNAKQVQLLLGHHSAAFTLETYIHLLPEDLPDLSFLETDSSRASLVADVRDI